MKSIIHHSIWHVYYTQLCLSTHPTKGKWITIFHVTVSDRIVNGIVNIILQKPLTQLNSEVRVFSTYFP